MNVQSPPRPFVVEAKGDIAAQSSTFGEDRITPSIELNTPWLPFSGKRLL
jgi:hypothetical protein